MPENKFTARVDHDYNPIKALQGFSVVMTCDYTVDSDDRCKLIGDPVVSLVVDNSAPLWRIVSGPTSNHWLGEIKKMDCTSSKGNLNKADEVHCQGNVTMALDSPGIPTPWGSIGSIRLAEVQVQVDFWVCSDGSTRQEIRIDGDVVK